MSARVTFQIAPGKFPEPQQRALNDVTKQIADAFPTLLDNVFITELSSTATLPQAVAKINQIVIALQKLGLKSV